MEWQDPSRGEGWHLREAQGETDRSRGVGASQRVGVRELFNQARKSPLPAFRELAGALDASQELSDSKKIALPCRLSSSGDLGGQFGAGPPPRFSQTLTGIQELYTGGAGADHKDVLRMKRRVNQPFPVQLIHGGKQSFHQACRSLRAPLYCSVPGVALDQRHNDCGPFLQQATIHGVNQSVSRRTRREDSLGSECVCGSTAIASGQERRTIGPRGRPEWVELAQRGQRALQNQFTDPVGFLEAGGVAGHRCATFAQKSLAVITEGGDIPPGGAPAGN